MLSVKCEVLFLHSLCHVRDAEESNYPECKSIKEEKEQVQQAKQRGHFTA